MHYYLYDRSRSAIHPKSVRTNERPVRPPQPSDACNECTKRPPPFPDYPESQPQTMHVFLTFCHKSSHNALLPSRSVSIDRHRRRRDPRRCPVVRDREKKNQSICQRQLTHIAKHLASATFQIIITDFVVLSPHHRHRFEKPTAPQ